MGKFQILKLNIFDLQVIFHFMWKIDPENMGKNARFTGLSWKLTELVF